MSLLCITVTISCYNYGKDERVEDVGGSKVEFLSMPSKKGFNHQ